MFLAINLNAAKAKKRKKEKQQRRAKQQIKMSNDVGGTQNMEMTTQGTTNLDNIIGENVTKIKCKNCQHLMSSTGDLLHHEQRSRQRHSSLGEDCTHLPLTPPACLCNCGCVYKEQKTTQHRDSLTSNATSIASETKATNKTSLFTVYICLGTLTLAVATIAVLLYSHVTSSSIDNDALSWKSQTNEFRVNFLRELAASEQILHNMVVEILQEQQKIPDNYATKNNTR